METVEPYQAPRITRLMAATNKWLAEDFLGGPRVIKLAWVVNLQKGATVFFVLGLMFVYDNFTASAWTYLALHGSYGFIWLLKDAAFPDPSFEKKVTIGGAVMVWTLVLGLYWVAPVLLISDLLGPDRLLPSTMVMSIAVAVHSLGVVIMTVSDAQKYFTLQNKRGLIETGMFKYIRHPNYLGEMMIYGSYALLAMHWVPWAILAWVWIDLFATNMLMKEASMSRYPQWRAYKARTGMLLPWPFG